MPKKEEEIRIHIFEKADRLPNDEQSTFEPTDFGGTIPQVGDLIAIPTLQAFSRDPRENPRMRRVVERYFWPRIDPKIPARIILLVREQRSRKFSGKRTVTDTTSIPSDIPFIVQQIFTCLNLAKECGDADVAASLRKLAGAFSDRAIALGADPETIPRGTSKSST
jgi:hypothetical protein